jgi:hypothetical protein
VEYVRVLHFRFPVCESAKYFYLTLFKKSIWSTYVQESAAQWIDMIVTDLASLYFYGSPFLCSGLWLTRTPVIEITCSDGKSKVLSNDVADHFMCCRRIHNDNPEDFV